MPHLTPMLKFSISALYDSHAYSSIARFPDPIIWPRSIWDCSCAGDRIPATMLEAPPHDARMILTLKDMQLEAPATRDPFYNWTQEKTNSHGEQNNG